MVWRFKFIIRIYRSAERLEVKILNINDKIKRSIIENVLVISIMVLYIVYGINYVPILILFTPLPFIVVGVRNGISNNVISMAITSLIVGVLIGAPSAISLLLIFAPLSFALNYCIKKRKSIVETILITTTAFFLSTLVVISLGSKASDLDFIKLSEQTFTQILTIQTDMFRETGMTNHELLQTENLLESAYKYIIITIPSLLAVFALCVSYINHLFVSIILRRMGYGVVNSPKFSRFKLPSNIIPGIGIMFLSAFIIKRLEIPYHDALLLNITFLVGFIFFTQGLAVLDFLLIKSKVKLIFRVIIITLNIVFMPMSGIVFFIGVLDAIFDMRKIRKQKSL